MNLFQTMNEIYIRTGRPTEGPLFINSLAFDHRGSPIRRVAWCTNSAAIDDSPALHSASPGNIGGSPYLRTVALRLDPEPEGAYSSGTENFERIG